MKEKILKERGITLIALIVTIIVLLILAGITIRVVINTGVLNNTEKATDVYEEKTIREAIGVKITKYEINSMNEATKDYFGYLQKEGIITEIEGAETEEKGKKAEVNTQTLIKTKTKRKYYVYENGELYVEILKSDAEKYIANLWDENGVIQFQEGTVGYLIENGLVHEGDFLEYSIPDENTYTVWKGTEDEFELTTENLRWRVLSIDEENKTLTLITNKPTNKGFIIPEEKTDDEAINELNNACDALYGDGEHECRNLDISDFSTDNDTMMTLVKGKGNENFYYDNTYEAKNSNYFSMLVTNAKDKLYCYSSYYGWEDETELIYDGKLIHCPHSSSNGPIEYSYLPMRPVLILDGDTEIKTNSIQVGDYVQYNMSTERSCDFYEEHLESEEIYWRVLSIDEENEKITLVTEKPVSKELQITNKNEDPDNSMQIVNNLNEACDTLYGDKFSECRNLSVDDFYYSSSKFNDKVIEEIIIGNGNEKFYYWGENCNYFHQSIVNR